MTHTFGVVGTKLQGHRSHKSGDFTVLEKRGVAVVLRVMKDHTPYVF